jgi:hypothetical protein
METPFAIKLSTNYIPLSHEIELIHQAIAGPLDAISQLNEKIVRLQTTVDGLSRERDELFKFVQAHRALLSGARRLPSELLQEIFLYCLPTDRNAVMSSDEAPVLLGRVCKLWKDISLSTPQLWSSLHVPTPASSFLTKHGREKLLQRERTVSAWLELSGSCPLSISFSSEYGTIEREDEEAFAATHLLWTIMNFSKRWKNVDFHMPLTIYEDCLSTLTEGDVPLLEQISFRPVLAHYLRTAVNWHPAPLFLVPSLRRVTLFSVDYRSDVFTLRWECLTHLSLIESGWGGLGVPPLLALDILRRCSNLIVCEMHLYSPNLISGPSLTLPSLRSLEITGGASPQFFEMLLLPAIQHFKYLAVPRLPSHAPTPRTLFKSIIMPGLERLELGMTTLDRDELVSECLPLLPSLKRFALTEIQPLAWELERPLQTLDNDFITLLTPSADSGDCLCPGLEEIVFEQCTAITDDAICPFLTAKTRFESPHQQIARLKHAKFSFRCRRVIDVIPDDSLGFEVT